MVKGEVREALDTGIHGEREWIASEESQSYGCKSHQLSALVPSHWSTERSEIAREPAGGRADGAEACLPMASIGNCSPRSACIV